MLQPVVMFKTNFKSLFKLRTYNFGLQQVVTLAHGFVCVCVCFVVLGIKPSALHMRGNHSTNGLQLQPLVFETESYFVVCVGLELAV